MIPDHVQHVIKIFQAFLLRIFYSVEGQGLPGSNLAVNTVESGEPLYNSEHNGIWWTPL